MQHRRTHLVALIVAALAAAMPSQPAAGQMDISADVYGDKLHGMWVGQLLGNYAGRPVEGGVARGGLTYTVDWDTVTSTTTWNGDDDTCFELLYTDVLNENADPTSAQIGSEWVDHVKPNTFYIANKQARWLMSQGFPPPAPPATGSRQLNRHWYAIDSQIATESIGGLAPGMRQRAADLTERFASVSNDGYAVHASQFYSAMYAAATFESDVAQLIDAAARPSCRPRRDHTTLSPTCRPGTPRISPTAQPTGAARRN